MKLIKIAYILFFGGLVFLYIYSQTLRPSKATLCEISEKGEVGEYVCTQGTVRYFYKKENFCLLTLENNSCSVKVVSFDCKNYFKKGETLYVIGKVSYYKGEKEIVAERIALSDLCK